MPRCSVLLLLPVPVSTVIVNKEGRYNFADIILGGQDGIVNVLGIVLGVAAATTDTRLIFVAGLAALGAESISMGAVAYTSMVARRRKYLKESSEEAMDLLKVPKKHTLKIKGIFRKWGYREKEADSLSKGIMSNPKAAKDFMLSFERNVANVDAGAPGRSFVTVLAATVIGSAIPLVPFIFFTKDIMAGAIGAVIVSGIALFSMGYYEAKTTIGSLWRSGVQLLIIGLAAGFAGYLIGHFVGALPI